MIVHVEDIFPANLPVRRFLEWDTFGLPCCEAKLPTLKRPSPGEGVGITFMFT